MARCSSQWMLLSCLGTCMLVTSQSNLSLSWSGRGYLPFARISPYGGYNSETKEVWIFGGADDDSLSATTFNSITIMNFSKIWTLTAQMPSGLKASSQCFTQINNTIYYINWRPSFDSFNLHALDMNDYTTPTTFVSTIQREATLIEDDAGMSHISFNLIREINQLQFVSYS